MNLILSLLLFCGVTFAAVTNNVVYNVVAFPREFKGDKVALILDGVKIDMLPFHKNSLWTVTAAVPSHDFHFAILSSSGATVKEETLNREWKNGTAETGNLIFGKLNNSFADSSIVSLPRAFERLPNEDEFSRIFQEGEVQIINIIADETVLYNLHNSVELAKHGSDTDTTVEMAFINNDKVKYFTNVTLSFSGMGTRGHAKRPYKIKLSDGDGEIKDNRVLFGRKSFKLRNLVFDCTYVRQKILTDIGHSMGLILPQVGFARLYMNGEPYGLYELTDNPKKNWIKKIIHIDSLAENQEVGSYYKGVSYSDEVFIPATFREETDELFKTLYECEVEAPGQEEYTDIKKFTKWLSTINSSSTESEIREKFEVDLFLKYMLIEYLAGHWDGYWIGGNNFYLYHNPVTDKYLVISFDFDLTLGTWDPYPADTPYSVWGVSKKSTIPPLLVEKILKHPVFNKLFNEYIKTTIQKVFNVNAVGPRLDYFKELLHDDIAWDRTLTPKAVALSESAQFTLEDALKNYDTSACQSDYGIKEWIQGRSEFLAKEYAFTIPTELDFKLGEIGKRIVKKSDDAKDDSNNKGVNSANLKGEDSNSAAASSIVKSSWTLLIFAVFFFLI